MYIYVQTIIIEVSNDKKQKNNIKNLNVCLRILFIKTFCCRPKNVQEFGT